MTMVVGMDIDGVLADFVGGWVRKYNLEYGGHVSVDDVTDWDRGAGKGLTHFESLADFWAWLDREPWFWARLEPIPGAVGWMHELRSHGIAMRYVTTRPKPATQYTEWWLEDHGFKGQLHVMQHSKKTEVQADVYVDDSPEVLRHYHEQEVIHVQFLRPWNEHLLHEISDPRRFTVRSWEQLYRLLSRMAGVFS